MDWALEKETRCLTLLGSVQIWLEFVVEQRRKTARSYVLRKMDRMELIRWLHQGLPMCFKGSGTLDHKSRDMEQSNGDRMESESAAII